MPAGNVWGAIGQTLGGINQGLLLKMKLEAQKKDRLAKEKMDERLIALRELLAMKPTVTSQGIMEWQPERWERSGDLGAEQTQIPAGWGWTPHEKEPGTELTPEQEAQLKLKYNKEWWDYQVGHPKPTAQERGAEAKTDQQFLTEYARVRDDHRMLQTQIRMMQAQEIPVPAWMHRGVAEMGDWVKANTAKRDKLIGATAPGRKAVGATPSGQTLFSNTALTTPPDFPELGAFMEAGRKKLLEENPKAQQQNPEQFAQDMAALRREWMDRVAEYWRVHGGQ